MKSFLTLKMKIVIIFTILISATLLGGYVYLTKMERVSGNLNINKSNPIDKLCNYTIYSDFYYRVTDYSNQQTYSYSELTPVGATICYDFKNSMVELQSYVDEKNNIILDDKNGVEVEKKVALLENFKAIYAQIIATQDKDYFDTSYQTAGGTILSLYGKNKMGIVAIDPLKKYYTQIQNLPIENMKVEHFKLDKITTNPIQSTVKSEWTPNILEWNFEENDKIYLQYLSKFKNNDLEDYIKSNFAKSNKTVIKLTKFNNNILNKMFLIFDDKHKKIKTLFMDNNGYIYLLILKVSNKKSFETYFNDYLKIAYGIFFIKQNKLDSSFIKQQEAIESSYKQYINGIAKINNLYKKLEDNQCTDMLKNYKEMDFVTQLINSKSKINKMNKSDFDIKYEYFKKLYGSYPNDEIVLKVKHGLENLQLLIDGIEEFKPLVAIPFKNNRYQEGFQKLQKKCSTIGCIRALKDKNWKEEEK